MRREFLAACAAVATVVASGGCITPSIPIPPPDPALMSFSISAAPGATTAVFAYPATHNYAGSVVYLYNRDQGVGIILDANADGSVGPSQPLAAVAGNQVVVTFQIEDQSVSSCVRLRDGAQDPNNYCD